MIPPKVKQYLLTSIEGTPIVLRAVLGEFAPDDMIWDMRPIADRFTLREMLAHIADWDPIFLERMQRTVAEDFPTLPDIDEGELAIEREYSKQNPLENLARLEKSRGELVGYLKSLDENLWERKADRPPVGILTIETQAIMILAHDGYHLRQASEYTTMVPL